LQCEDAKVKLVHIASAIFLIVLFRSVIGIFKQGIMFSKASVSPDRVPKMISNLEAKRDHQEQKSADMLARARAALKEGRRDAAKSCLAQRVTHDAAAAQYSALISTLTQQQAISDLANAHREIASVIKTMKSNGDMSGILDRAAETADDVAAIQGEMSVMGGSLFSGPDDLDSLLDSLEDNPESDPPKDEPNPVAEISSLPNAPTTTPKPPEDPPPEPPIEALGDAFAEIMIKKT